MLSDVLLLFGAVTVRPVVANMENFTLCTKRTEDVSHPDPSGSPHPCSPDTPSEADRHELLYDILRLPTTYALINIFAPIPSNSMLYFITDLL